MIIGSSPQRLDKIPPDAFEHMKTALGYEAAHGQPVSVAFHLAADSNSSDAVLVDCLNSELRPTDTIQLEASTLARLTLPFMQATKNWLRQDAKVLEVSFTSGLMQLHDNHRGTSHQWHNDLVPGRYSCGSNALPTIFFAGKGLVSMDCSPSMVAEEALRQGVAQPLYTYADYMYGFTENDFHRGQHNYHPEALERSFIRLATLDRDSNSVVPLGQWMTALALAA